MSGTNLTNHFLIAMPALDDPNFAQTVTFVCEHNEDGAMGIVINRPTDLTLGELFDHLEIEPQDPKVAAQNVFLGGPVQRERGFVLHHPEGAWDSSLRISEQISITTSKDILAAIARAEGPPQYLIALGYAGWGPGQLEAEMGENSWLSGPADPAVLFERESAQRWRAAAALLGVDLALLSPVSGHA